MIEYVEDERGLVAIRISESIQKEEYEALLPEIKKQIKLSGKINLYLEIGDDVNLEGRNFWSDIRFDLKHAQDIRKVAFIGDEQLEEQIIALFKPLENAEIRWYNYADRQKALRWVKG